MKETLNKKIEDLVKEFNEKFRYNGGFGTDDDLSFDQAEAVANFISSSIRKVVEESLVDVYSEAITVSGTLNQIVGENNDFYITSFQLEKILTEAKH